MARFLTSKELNRVPGDKCELLYTRKEINVFSTPAISDAGPGSDPGSLDIPIDQGLALVVGRHHAPGLCAGVRPVLRLVR